MLGKDKVLLAGVERVAGKARGQQRYAQVQSAAAAVTDRDSDEIMDEVEYRVYRNRQALFSEWEAWECIINSLSSPPYPDKL